MSHPQTAKLPGWVRPAPRSLVLALVGCRGGQHRIFFGPRQREGHCAQVSQIGQIPHRHLRDGSYQYGTRSNPHPQSRTNTIATCLFHQ